MFTNKIRFTGNDIAPFIGMSFFFYVMINLFSHQLHVIFPLFLAFVFSLVVMIVSLKFNWKRLAVMMYLGFGGVGCFFLVIENIPRDDSLRVVYALSASAFILLYSIITNLSESVGAKWVLLKRICSKILLPLSLAFLLGNFAFTAWQNNPPHRIMMVLTSMCLAYAFSAFIYSRHMFWANLILYLTVAITMGYLAAHSINSSPALIFFYETTSLMFFLLVPWLLSTRMKKKSINHNSDAGE